MPQSESSAVMRMERGMGERKIAALFVDAKGCYAGLPDVDAWDEKRDARLYPGPYPVVAHPPCSRWCRLAGLVEARWGHKRGEDGGCFASALASVRKWGGCWSIQHTQTHGQRIVLQHRRQAGDGRVLIGSTVTTGGRATSSRIATDTPQRRPRGSMRAAWTFPSCDGAT
jgi:hypothetical protein